jgi:hypothetical protein
MLSNIFSFKNNHYQKTMRTHHLILCITKYPSPHIIAKVDSAMIHNIFLFCRDREIPRMMSCIKQEDEICHTRNNILGKVCFQEVQWMLHLMRRSLVLQSAEQSQHRQEPDRVHHLCHHLP